MDGHCDRVFEPMHDALAGAVISDFEVGAALAVYLDLRAVVNLWGGHADAARTRRWQRDTIVNQSAPEALDDRDRARSPVTAHIAGEGPHAGRVRAHRRPAARKREE